MNAVVHAITRIVMAGPAPVLDAISVIAVLALAYIATTAGKEIDLQLQTLKKRL